MTRWPARATAARTRRRWSWRRTTRRTMRRRGRGRTRSCRGRRMRRPPRRPSRAPRRAAAARPPSAQRRTCRARRPSRACAATRRPHTTEAGVTRPPPPGTAAASSPPGTGRDRPRISSARGRRSPGAVRWGGIAPMRPWVEMSKFGNPFFRIILLHVFYEKLQNCEYHCTKVKNFNFEQWCNNTSSQA